MESNDNNNSPKEDLEQLPIEDFFQQDIIDNFSFPTMAMKSDLSDAISQSIQSTLENTEDNDEDSTDKKNNNFKGSFFLGCFLKTILILLSLLIIFCITIFLLYGKDLNFFIKEKISDVVELKNKLFQEFREETTEKIFDINNNLLSTVKTEDNTIEKGFNKNFKDNSKELEKVDAETSEETAVTQENVLLKSMNITESAEENKPTSQLDKENSNDNFTNELQNLEKQLLAIEDDDFIDFSDTITSFNFNITDIQKADPAIFDKIQQKTPPITTKNAVTNSENPQQSPTKIDNNITAKTVVDKKEKDIVYNLILKYGLEKDDAKLITDILEKNSIESNFSFSLLTAIVAAESSFDSQIKSDKNKVGLLQLSAEDLDNIKNSLNLNLAPKENDLTDPDYNLKIGIAYLLHLKSKFNGNIEKAIIAKATGLKEFKEIENNKKKLPISVKKYLQNIDYIFRLIKKQQKEATRNSESPKQEIKNSVTTNLEPLLPPQKSTYEVKFDRKLAAKNILLAKDLTGILKWTVVPEEKQAQMAQMINSEANKYGLDPLFIAAIIMSESSFDEEIVSQDGKIGLLQIHPYQGANISNITKIHWKGGRALLDPEYNLSLGIAYLNYCLKKYPGNLKIAMIAYNSGIDKAEEALASEKIPQSFLRYLSNIEIYLSKWGAKLP